MSKILFIGAHTDDIEISCGGTIARMQEEGHTITCIVMSNCGSQVLEDEFFAATDSLLIETRMCQEFPVRQFQQYRQNVLDYLVGFKGFDKVFTHCRNDRHQDHKVVGEESLRAFRDCNMFTYASGINRISGVENYHVKLSSYHMDCKLAALACYKSQVGRVYMKPVNIIAQARIAGLRGGCEFAESFEIVKYVRH